MTMKEGMMMGMDGEMMGSGKKMMDKKPIMEKKDEMMKKPQHLVSRRPRIYAYSFAFPQAAPETLPRAASYRLRQRT